MTTKDNGSAPVSVDDANIAVPAAPPEAPPRRAVPVATGGTTNPPPSSRSSKSKKKKGSSSLSSSANENTGRWTAEEHRLFLQGLEQHGKGWKKIASLIKSRTVVQIRTHAQKYFQKLAKARQNGEEGDVTMEGRGSGISLASDGSIIIPPRRRKGAVLTGTKRKAIQSVVASAQRQGKKLAAASEDDTAIPPLPAVAPALAHFVLVTNSNNNSAATSGTAPPPTTTANSGIPAPGTVTGAALEDAIFRFLTPAPPADCLVNSVARQAGANPISLPTEQQDGGKSPSIADGEVSPTGVDDLIHPSWTDAKDTPSWYAKGADVDALLDVADDLDWLADSGDMNETYQPPPIAPPPPVAREEVKSGGKIGEAAAAESNKHSASVSSLPRVESNMETMVPSLPSLFNTASTENLQMHKSTSVTSSTAGQLKVSPSGASMLEAHMQVFDTPMEEHDFVSTILENDTEASTDHLPSLE